MKRARLPDAAPPKPVQRWSASDYARNGRFVQELAGAIFAMLEPRPGERILDLGCGDGTLTAEIKASGADVLGVDLSDELLAVARMKGLRVRKLDGHALDFSSEFDAVFSNAALHWMRQPALVIAGVARALRLMAASSASSAVMAMSRRSPPAMRAVGTGGTAIRRSSRPGSFRRSRISLSFSPRAGSQYARSSLCPGRRSLKTGIEGWLRTFGRSFFDQFSEPERTQWWARSSTCSAFAVRRHGDLDRRPYRLRLSLNAPLEGGLFATSMPK